MWTAWESMLLRSVRLAKPHNILQKPDKKQAFGENQVVKKEQVMVTIKDVAKEAGVAISTVSNVINNVGNVSEETKKKVLAVVENMNYVPNFNARSLKANKKNTVGLFLSSIQGDYYRVLTQAIHLQCKMAGFMLNIYVSNENTSEEIYGMIVSSGVEGAIIMNECLESDHIKRIARTGLPMVFLERECRGEKISSVTIDNYMGTELVMEYLIRQGHRSIGYIHGVECRDDCERFRAYAKTLERNGLPIDARFLLYADFEEIKAYEEVRKFLMRERDIPDAFFCANDEMAGGCMRALAESRVRVPEQVSVAGFDNINLAQYFVPALTTVQSPVEEQGTKGALELFRLMRGEGEPEGKSLKLATSIIIRDSSIPRR